MLRNAIFTVGQEYQTVDGDAYNCIGVEPNQVVFRRPSDNWTVYAYDADINDKGLVVWGSTCGQFEK